jgi:trimethylamine---corrinoid protein Co-methyltransferase
MTNLGNEKTVECCLQKSVLLKEDEINKIIDVVFDYIEKTGVQFEKDEYVYGLFKDAGCSIDADGFVKIPKDVLQKYLEQCPKQFDWWNRAGTECLKYGGGETYFIADCRATNYIDPSTLEKKESDDESLAKMVQLIDALPEFEICGVPLTTDDFVQNNATVIKNTTKPLILNSGDNLNVLKATVDMASELRGGKDALKEKPYFATILSPLILFYPKFIGENMRMAVENNIPIFMSTMPIGGVSGPVTIAGTLTIILATTLPGVMLTQLMKKGHPCNEFSFPAFMDPATGNVGGYPENSMADAARLQVCKKLGLPLSQQTALPASSEEFNQDAMIESALDLERLQPYSFDAFWGAGTLESGLVFSPHALVYANDLASLTRRGWKGVTLDENNFAVDLIEEVKGGLYTSEDHTACNTRKSLWRGKYTAPKGPASIGKDMGERIHDNLQKIIAKHIVEELDEKTLTTITEIADKYSVLKS